MLSLQVLGQEEVRAESECAASVSAAAAHRGSTGSQDPGQRHPGRPAPGESDTPPAGETPPSLANCLVWC